RVASEAYSSSLIQRSNQIKENLGTLERAWNSLGEMAGKAWNAMLNVGRESSVEQKIQQTQDMLDRARSDLANMQKGGSVDTGNYGYGR
ncbi:phage tail tape measure protein, partial [Salmonella enterica subsp. enterica serovar Reading]|nr:phage tail tape measure protein [Salmonella enterica subsp. enterica serovar Reading]